MDQHFLGRSIEIKQHSFKSTSIISPGFCYQVSKTSHTLLKILIVKSFTPHFGCELCCEIWESIIDNRPKSSSIINNKSSFQHQSIVFKHSLWKTLQFLISPLDFLTFNVEFFYLGIYFISFFLNFNKTTVQLNEPAHLGWLTDAGIHMWDSRLLTAGSWEEPMNKSLSAERGK